MKRYLFRFKVIDQYGSVVNRGLASNILHSNKWLFEYVNDGRVFDSLRLTLDEFTCRALALNCDIQFEACYNADSVPFNHKISEYV